MRKKLLKRLSAFLNIFLVVLLLIPNFVIPANVFAEVNTLTAPVLVFPVDGVFIKNNKPLMDWEDYTFPDGSQAKKYDYIYYYNCPNDANDLTECARNYPYSTKESQYQAGQTANGLGFWKVRAEDSQGNKSEWSTPAKFTIDTIKPKASIESSTIQNGDALITGTATDNIKIKTHWFEIIDPNNKSFAFLKYTNKTNVETVSFKLSELKDQQDNLINLVDGEYRIRYVVTDAAGNRNDDPDFQNPTIHTLYLDVAPSIPTGLYWKAVDNNNEVVECGGYSNTHHVTEHWNAVSSHDLSHYEYSSFNAPYGSAGLVEMKLLTNYFNSSWWNIPREGTYGFQVRSVDTAGNKSAWALGNIVGIENACRITIDWTDPVVTITSPSADTYVKGTVDFRGTVNEPNLLRYWYRILNLETDKSVASNTIYADTGFENKLIYRWDTTKNSDGVYEVRLDARDKAWNKSEIDSIDTISVIVDNTAPVGDISGIRYDNTKNGDIVDVSNFITNDKSPLIYGTYGDNYEVDTVEVKIGETPGTVALDGSGNWTAQFPDLADGTYDISLKITDKAGNETELTQEIVIDSVAPRAIYTHYIDGEVFEGDIAEVKSLSQLSFTASYTDEEPSSGLKYDSFAIFQAQDDGSFRFSANGKKAYCSWRRAPNLVDLSGTTYELTEQVPFTNCIETLPDGEYYMAHHVYDNAVRKDIPTIMQFRDVLGLHFKIKNTPVVTISSPYTEVVQGALSFTIEATATDGNAPLTYEWTGPNGVVSNESSFVFSPSTAGTYTFTVRVTDTDGDYDEDTITITVNEPPQIPLVENPDNPEVLGTNTTTTTTVKTTPKNRTLYAVNVVDTSSEVTEQEESSDEIKEDIPEVLGEEETSCKVKRSLSGYVYVDKNKNNIKDKNEKVFENIKIKVTTTENGEEKTVEELLTDVKGEWETTLCPGKYSITIDTTTIPKGYKLNGDSTVEVNVLDNSERLVQPFHLSETKTFIQKYWWVLLLIILLLTGLVVSKSKRENE